MNKNLVSLKTLKMQLGAAKWIAPFVKGVKREDIINQEKRLNDLISQAEKFNDRFSNYGWCAYESISFELIKNVNAEFDISGLENAEKLLIAYYKTDIENMIPWIKNASTAFSVRYELIQSFFKSHFAGDYYASVPLGLIIIDGAVNDFTKSKGFFAEGTEVNAWDCLVGCSNALTKLKDLFNSRRTKTNSEPIRIPYRNGILHGRDLNYANEYVSCKCVALMFAVADWMKQKDSEEQRKEKYFKKSSFSDVCKSLYDNSKRQKEIGNWKKREVVVGIDVAKSGTKEDYSNYPYIVKIIEMFDSWNKKNYGKLSELMRHMFWSKLSPGKRAGECRAFFINKNFISYELVSIEELSCASARVVVNVKWEENGKIKLEELEFGCIYLNEEDTSIVALPWRNDGEWVIMPWGIQGLYKS